MKYSVSMSTEMQVLWYSGYRLVKKKKRKDSSSLLYLCSFNTVHSSKIFRKCSENI